MSSILTPSRGGWPRIQRKMTLHAGVRGEKALPDGLMRLSWKNSQMYAANLLKHLG